MTQSPLSIQNMSPVTREFLAYEQKVLKQDQTFLIGRIVTLGVSLILHAEAVCRAVYICFLSIKDIFSRSNEELIKRQREECSIAFNISLKSFFSPQTILTDLLVESPKEVRVASVQSAPIIPQPQPVAVPSIVCDFQPYAGEGPPRINAAYFPRAAQLPHDFTMVRNVVSPTSPDDFKDGFVSLQHPAQERDVSPDFESPPQSPNHHHTPSAFSVLVQAAAVAVLHPANSLQPPRQTLSAQEETLVKQAEERAQRQRAAQEEELRIKGVLEVRRNLQQTYDAAQTDIDLPRGILAYQRNLKENDRKWTLSEMIADKWDAVFCHYSPEEDGLKTEHLVKNFTFKQQFPCQLFGIFDPQIGPRASSYLVENLEKVLIQQLEEQNKKDLSVEGIYNAISLTFLKLNHQFLTENGDRKIHPILPPIGDHGSSATVVIVLANNIWTAHLGNSRAIIQQQNIALQLTGDPNPLLPINRARVEDLGGTVDEEGLVNGKLPMVTAFGRNDLCGTVSARPNISRVPVDTLLQGGRIIIGNHPIFKTASTNAVVQCLHTHPDEIINSARNLVYSVVQRNQEKRSVACIIAGLDGWEEV